MPCTILGPAAGGRLALIRLRANQASLLTRGILLRWQSTAFGPAAADKLTTWLTRWGVAETAEGKTVWFECDA
ncbi:hypothetical protein ABT034_29605 [Streptomyces sp. NPDC002773]|uniref:hypothetical protein n=1 Tax=Streptomyces sp. NPDC002773 TaxID=3154430 RepID=UPI0033342761